MIPKKEVFETIHQQSRPSSSLRFQKMEVINKNSRFGINPRIYRFGRYGELNIYFIPSALIEIIQKALII